MRFIERVPFVVCILAALALASSSARLLPAQALSPQEALQRFKVAEGFDVQLFASEPEVRQPLTMTFDDRGRMWVIQYLQYPAPSGLKPVTVDRYLRTKYDRVPEPPPKGPRGADRITILEDTDGDGRVDHAKDFVGGLNLASALALGDGGVYVGAAPYLLFYPDRDGDDVPDGDPQVLLTGFGMEDAHAVVNSLQWGPDGWLYGAQGSTVTADVRGIGFQQGIWRYHPPTKRFELFSEGGGNTWGLDFDRHGGAIAGTNWGDAVCLHQVQGAYYIKGFSKHGPLHNPYTYGYFEHCRHTGPSGGHVTCGGIVYQATAFPETFRNAYIGPNLLSNAIYWSRLEPAGSTYGTRYVGTLLSTDDVWFRPIDCITGPDGSIYVADWYDQRANHVIPEDTWDRTNGRIWKIVAHGTEPTGKLALAKPLEPTISSACCRTRTPGIRARHVAFYPKGEIPLSCLVCARSSHKQRTNICRSRPYGRCTAVAVGTTRLRSLCWTIRVLIFAPGLCALRATIAGHWATRCARGSCNSPRRNRVLRSAANWPAPANGSAEPTACRSSNNCCAATRTPTICTFRSSCGGPSKIKPLRIASVCWNCSTLATRGRRPWCAIRSSSESRGASWPSATMPGTNLARGCWRLRRGPTTCGCWSPPWRKNSPAHGSTRCPRPWPVAWPRSAANNRTTRP